MNPHDDSNVVPPYAPGNQASEIAISQLIGKVFEAAATSERCRILEQLMKPLGVLALVAVANGVFAKLWFRSGWHELHVQPDDAQLVRTDDVISLANYVQQASTEAIDGLAQLLTVFPMMACSAAAVMLVTVLVNRAQYRRKGIEAITNLAIPQPENTIQTGANTMLPTRAPAAVKDTHSISKVDSPD